MPLQLLAQPSVWERWGPEIVARLHTADNSEYLTEEEKKVVLFMNMARHNGLLFVRYLPEGLFT